MPYECRCIKCGLLVVNPAGACSEFKSAINRQEVSSNGGYQDDSK